MVPAFLGKDWHWCCRNESSEWQCTQSGLGHSQLAISFWRSSRSQSWLCSGGYRRSWGLLWSQPVRCQCEANQQWWKSSSLLTASFRGWMEFFWESLGSPWICSWDSLPRPLAPWSSVFQFSSFQSLVSWFGSCSPVWYSDNYLLVPGKCGGFRNFWTEWDVNCEDALSQKHPPISLASSFWPQARGCADQENLSWGTT